MTPPRNRLADESSPYLLLHAHNPVDWYPWGDDAFEKARNEDKPIFLSVGYSTCYWCHVMERECFSDPEIARQMNDGFVSIKLDREERPDVDEIYMTATQLLTQAGGWPNSVFLTPDRKPFFAGTYFPPSDRMGRPGFPRVLTSLREAWALRRSEVLEQAEVLADAIRDQLASVGEAPVLPDAGVVAGAQSGLARRFDPEWGGFGPAPKFPSPSNLSFLLDRATEGDTEAREMLVVTLDRMARGGIHDQLGGGFHRYSTDGEWLVPHFEKMLYDNAALAGLYAEAAPLAPDAGFDRVARATLDFVFREMTAPDGAFLSAIDAETDGHEGAYYTWTREELAQALDPEALALLGEVYGLGGRPTFESDRYVLHLPKPLGDQARALGLSVADLLARLEPGRRALMEARDRRKRPLTDDKVLADWNGLMIGAMARGGRALGNEPYLVAARRAAEFVLAHLVDPASGTLLHAFRAGVAKVPALLDDYAFLVEGLLALHAATGEDRWLDEASRLAAEQERRLGDESAGGYFAAADSPDLLARGKPAHDGAVASGNGVSALNLLELERLRAPGETPASAERLLAAFGRAMDQWPQAHMTLVRAALRRGAVPATPAREAKVVAPSAAASVAATAGDVVQARGELGEAPGAWKPFAVELKVREGWHLNANPALLRFLVATELKPRHGALRGLRYPGGERYEGVVRIEGEIEVVAGPPPTVSLTYQPCDEERCLTPVTRDLPPPMSLIEPCDALYVSARAGEAELACPARMESERERGLRVLVVTLFDGGTGHRDALFLGLPGARDRNPGHDPWTASPAGAAEEAWIADTAAILDDVFVRARPRHLYLPLGVGGFAERRVAHEAARRTFQAAAGRDIFFYEERPEAFVSGSVRIRLGLLGARLPPAGSKIAGEGGMLRFLVRFQTVPRVHAGLKGLGNRIRCARLAAGQWRGARAWRPQRAMGPRLQPMIHASPASALEGIRGTIRATMAQAGLPASADRMVAWSEDYARRLGEAGHAERYWLLLPNRDDDTRAVVSETEGSAIS